MIILGINEDHNATAALIKDGIVLACASEERFTKIKNDTEYPRKAIDSILAQTGIHPSQIDHVAFAGIYCDPVQMRLKRVTRYKISDYVREMHEHWHKVLIEKKESTYWQDLLQDPRFTPGPDNYYDYSFMATKPKEAWPGLMNEARCGKVIEHIGISRDRIHFIDHHSGHAHYAYFAAPHEHTSKKAVIVTADGWGDGCNATISVIDNGTIREIKRTQLCNIARVYRWITLVLGMKPNEHEYKVMGLAPYSNEYITKPAYEIFRKTLVVDGLDFRWNFQPPDMYFYFREAFEGLRFDGIAAGVQQWVEELLSQWITNIMTLTGAEVLYYSGGLSMNVKANKMIAELALVKDFHVPPSGGDESLAIGAAFVLSCRLGITPFALKNAYLGYEPTVEESRAAVASYRNLCGYTIIDNPSETEIAGYLQVGKVLGRCVGKMEFGARSLGNRAIICDASHYENVRVINEKIKFRDFWMPFTPSILYERACDYIVNPKNLNAGYMTIAFDSTPLARDHLKAAIHPYDFTVRPQLVSPDTNKGYYDLIKVFEKKTGIGGVLNTSLNLHGYPIVCTAEDAIDTFVRSGLDGMILPGLLILKQ
jgi:carbamoyltransferase